MSNAAIISVDGHARATRRGFREYVDPAFMQTFDDWIRDAEDRGIPDVASVKGGIDEAGQWDAAQRLRDLETQGVVAEVLFPNGVPFQSQQFDDSGRASDPALTRAGARAYNRWLADFCSQAPERFRGQAIVHFDDINAAVAEVQWAASHGLGGIMMPGLYPGDPFFFDPTLDPIWGVIEETGLPISQHGGTGTPTYAPPGLAAILTLAYEHAFFSGRSLWQLIVGGVFDRFPGLRVGYIETEAHWIGPALQHFDRRLRMNDDWMQFAAFLQRERSFSRLPSEYWETNCYAGISPFHPNQLPFDKLGSGYTPADGEFALRSTNVMFGVDYPHFESIYPDTAAQTALLRGEPSITEGDLQRVLFGNAAELYGFDAAALAPHVARLTAVP